MSGVLWASGRVLKGFTLACQLGCLISPQLLIVCASHRDETWKPPLHTPQGVYAGGVESASELVRLRQAAPQEFRLLAGYSGWGPWQLQSELASGLWWVVAASHELILELLTGASCGGAWGSGHGGSCPSEPGG